MLPFYCSWQGHELGRIIGTTGSGPVVGKEIVYPSAAAAAALFYNSRESLLEE